MADYTAILGGAALGAVASFFVGKKTRGFDLEKVAVYAAGGAGAMFLGKAVFGSKSGDHAAAGQRLPYGFPATFVGHGRHHPPYGFPADFVGHGQGHHHLPYGFPAGFVGAAADCGPTSYWDAASQSCIPISIPQPTTGPTTQCPPGTFFDYFKQTCVSKSPVHVGVQSGPAIVGVQSGPAIVGWGEEHRGWGHEHEHHGFGHDHSGRRW